MIHAGRRRGRWPTAHVQLRELDARIHFPADFRGERDVQLTSIPWTHVHALREATAEPVGKRMEAERERDES